MGFMPGAGNEEWSGTAPGEREGGRRRNSWLREPRGVQVGKRDDGGSDVILGKGRRVRDAGLIFHPPREQTCSEAAASIAPHGECATAAVYLFAVL